MNTHGDMTPGSLQDRNRDNSAVRRNSIIGGCFGLGVFLGVHAIWISAVIMEGFGNPVTIAAIAVLAGLGFYAMRQIIRGRRGFAAGFLTVFGILMLLFGLCVAITVP